MKDIIIEEDEDKEIDFEEGDFEGLDLDAMWNDMNGISTPADDTEEDSDDDTESEEEDEGEDSEEPAEDAEESEEESEEEEESEAEEEQPEEEAEEKTYELIHPTKSGKYTLEEMRNLAQKGLDYDHVREARDAEREENKSLKVYKEFVDDMVKHTGAANPEEQMLRVRAAWLMSDASAKGDEMSEADAILSVQNSMKERAKVAAKDSEPEKPEPNGNTDTHSMVNDFLKEFPDVHVDDIPQSVFDECNKTGDLAGAYRKYVSTQLKEENAKLKAELEKVKLEKKNKERSTGTRKTAGKKHHDIEDDIEAYWRSL